ncbi:MAG TPA: serine/threonine-protein kinase, partial [Polyangiaceae bacterium]|nr:serine/threonine-protein kinase [Polyangiaceae bacterium]
MARFAAASPKLSEATTLSPDDLREEAPAPAEASRSRPIRRPRELDEGWPQAGSSLKHYELLRPLGRGAAGATFLARDPKLGRLVAVKVLLGRDEREAARLLKEARAAARCKHENVAVVHEVDEAHGCPYVVVEYLEGSSLRDWLARRARADDGGPARAENAATERVPPGQAVELMLPVVRALLAAHALGVVHRDLKPSNILLTDAGPVKVLDFALARRLDAAELAALGGPGGPGAGDDPFAPASQVAPLAAGRPGGEPTPPGALAGTLPYLAPEQWRGEEADPRADLWAVGVLLFRLVAGAHPLAPIASARQLAQVGAPDVPMPRARERCPDVGPLGDVIDRCLKKNKAERYNSAAELLAALEAIAPGRRAPA